MLGINRTKRPVELGPYPLERLKRDDSIIEQETAAPPSGSSRDLPTPTTALLKATWQHLDIFKSLRDIAPFCRQAPVPEDLQLRNRDVKGAAYFLDASQVGICALPESAWLDSESHQKAQTHGVVILVEYADPIDADNPAAQWVGGNEHILTTLRAAEIAVDISGQIGALGFTSRAHWDGATEVDLDKLAVLAGLAIRDDDELTNPFVQKRFALAVVTTNYELATDQPLDASASNGRNLGYFFGTSGAVSGFERWHRKRRPSHLGRYAVEKLKSVEQVTTEICGDEITRVPNRAIFYVRAARGDLGDKTYQQARRWPQKHPVSLGLVRPIQALARYQNGPVAPHIDTTSLDSGENARAIKALAHYLGAAMTGICEIPDYCWYSHDKRGNPIKPYDKYAVVMLIDQSHETFLGCCGNDWISGSQSMRAYLRGGEIAGVMAGHIRELGHPARAQTSVDSDVLHVPLVLHAGMGEQSRIGESAVNPFLGPRFKTVVLTTNMPLEVDRPIDFGLQAFCNDCNKCARECPSQAIPYGDKVFYNGYETWKPDSARCTKFRIINSKGSACGRCIKTCPLTKDVTWDGPLLPRLGSWLGIHATWLKPLITPLALRLDDTLGYGNPSDTKKWWLDLEATADKCFVYEESNFCIKPKGANRRMIRPQKKSKGANDIAYYPPSVLPPPDCRERYPSDAKQGVELSAFVETLEQARQRRARGEPRPVMYSPNWPESG